MFPQLVVKNSAHVPNRGKVWEAFDVYSMREVIIWEDVILSDNKAEKYRNKAVDSGMWSHHGEE